MLFFVLSDLLFVKKRIAANTMLISEAGKRNYDIGRFIFVRIIQNIQRNSFTQFKNKNLDATEDRAGILTGAKSSLTTTR